MAPPHEGADGHGVRNRAGLLLLGIGIFASNFQGESLITIRKTVTQVGLTLVATDGSGRFLSQLSPADIAVLDDGQIVSNFELRAASDYPLRIGIMLDLSDSTRKAWPLTEPLLTKFLKDLVRPSDRMLLVGFDTRVEMERPFSDPHEASSMIHELRGGGPTALYDAIYSTCQHATFVPQAEPSRSALVLFSDGEDNLSLRDLDQAIQSAQSKGIAVYTISVHRRRAQTPGDQVLHKIAEATGGRDFVVREGRQMQAALFTINSELRSYYMLYYTPQNEPPQRAFRRVRVVPARGTAPILRYREGYYTSPDAVR